MPYFFEDPFVTTELSVHGLRHDFPWDSVFRGGEAWVLAVQARLAITDRLAFIATKDGYTWLRPGSHSQLRAEEGLFDPAAGFKYVLLQHEPSGFVLTPALRFVQPVGQSDVLSGWGPERHRALRVRRASAGAAARAGQPRRLAALRYRTRESSYVFYHLHLSTPVLELLVPFVELNGTTGTRSGNGRNRVDTRSFGGVDLGTAQSVLHGNGATDHFGFEGADAVNLGATRVSGHTILTLALGARVPVTRRVSLAGYYELPVTERRDIFEQRVGLNAVYAF
jgi:hypothetical protein